MEGESLSVSFTRVVIANWNQSSLLMWGTLIYLPKNCSQKENICKHKLHSLITKKNGEIGLKGKDKFPV